MPTNHERDQTTEDARVTTREQAQPTPCTEQSPAQSLRAEADGGTGRQGRRLSRGGMLRAAAMGVASVGTATVLLHDAQPAEASTGEFATSDPNVPAVRATAYLGAEAMFVSDTNQTSTSGRAIRAQSIYGTAAWFYSAYGTPILADSSPYPNPDGVDNLNPAVRANSDKGTAGYFTSASGTGFHGDSGGIYPGIYGTCTGTGPSIFGDHTKTGDGLSGKSAGGTGVAGYSGNPIYPGQGYGGRFGISNDALAQLYLVPAGNGGHPTYGTHHVGELFMDPTGALYIFTTGGWQRVQTVSGPTDARVTHFSARRRGDRVAFQWRMADGKGVAGFELYAAGRRVNRETIRPHRARAYKVSTVWKGGGPFALHVLLRNGNPIVVHPG